MRPATFAKIVSTLLGVFVVTTLPPQVASAQSGLWPSTNGLIAFRSDRDGEPDVFTLDPTSGATVKLTENSGIADLAPAWSPDGERIAYIRKTGERGRPDLYVMTASGRGRERLTRTPVPERDPSWSPDGSMIAYSARTSPTGPFRIFLVGADGSAPMQLTTQGRGSADRSPIFSPDGTEVAFVSDRGGGFPDVYIADVDGTRTTRLTTNAFVDGNPAWTPDGTAILVERCCTEGSSELYAIDVASHGETALTASPATMEFDPVPSPDGTKIAFVAFDIGVGNLDIWVMNADGSGATRLTNDERPDLSPDWQPVPMCTVRGTGGDDAALVGTDGNDVVCGLAGNDSIVGGAGTDLILGGKGNDSVDGQDGNDMIVGDQGDDVLDGGPGYDVLDGGAGTDRCVPGADGGSARLCES
jgi:Tol biopolymer transport system component